MPEIVGIRFKPVSKVYYFGPGGYRDLAEGDPVVVQTARGEELGWVNIPLRTVPDEEIKGTLKTITRRATPLDLALMQEYRTREPQALSRCRDKVAEMEMPMQVVRAEYSFNGRRLLFAFISEQRVDFRELVRVLARSFKTRIEMKQIGARDKAKLIGGYGRCGRELCCSSWLTEFHPVSIRMAKQQGLPLAPSEISGLCGRLLCCLAYENEQYVDFKRSLPKVGTPVVTPQGEGVIVGLNVLTESAVVELGNELTVEVSPDEVQAVPSSKKEPAKSSGKRPRKRRRR